MEEEFENKEECILPNGETVVFYPEPHKYFVRGKEVSSITTLLSVHYGNSYAGVNPELLKRSADYGTAVHEELQTLIESRKENPGIPMISTYQEVNNYFNFVEPIYKINPLMTEKMVVLYDLNGEPSAAGRFDLLCEVDGKKTLADFKTTSTIKKHSVTGQLNLYLKAARQSGYLTHDEEMQLGVIHLSGEKSKFVPIPILNDDYYLDFVL